MRAALFWSSLAGFAALSACSSETEGQTARTEPFTVTMPGSGNELIAQVVDRFDVPACNRASPVGLMRKTGPDGVQIIKAFSAGPQCLEALEEAMGIAGFAEQEPDIYRYESTQGWSELVRIERSDDQPNSGIQWELIEP